MLVQSTSREYDKPMPMRDESRDDDSLPDDDHDGDLGTSSGSPARWQQRMLDRAAASAWQQRHANGFLTAMCRRRVRRPHFESLAQGLQPQELYKRNCLFSRRAF